MKFGTVLSLTYTYTHTPTLYTFSHNIRLLQQQSSRKGTMAALKAKVDSAGSDNKRGGTANALVKSTAGALVEDDDDAKLAADLEFKMMAMNLAAKEQQEYCSK